MKVRNFNVRAYTLTDFTNWVLTYFLEFDEWADSHLMFFERVDISDTEYDITHKFSCVLFGYNFGNRTYSNFNGVSKERLVIKLLHFRMIVDWDLVR